MENTTVQPRSFLHLGRFAIFSVILFTLVIFSNHFLTLFAAYPATQFNPGETLNPACAPTDENCSVLATWSASSTNTYLGLAGNVGIGTTTPTSKLTLVGNFSVMGTSSMATITDAVWNGQTISGTYLDKSGNWTGTLSGFTLNQIIAAGFSTTSAEALLATKNYSTTSFSTTSADFWKTQNNFFSTTSANAWSLTQNYSTSSFSTTSADYWLTTQNLSSGSSGFSTTSTNAWLTTKSTSDLTEGSNLYYTQNRFDLAFSNKSTDDLTEGVSNLYFTNTRADARVTALFPNLFATALTGTTTDALAQGSTNKYYSDSLVSALLNTYNKGYFYSTTSAEAWWNTKTISQGNWSTTSMNFWLGTKNTDNITTGINNIFFSTTTTRQLLSVIPGGITYSSSTGIFSVTSGYVIPTTASSTSWNNKLDYSNVSSMTNNSIPLWDGSKFITGLTSVDGKIGIGTTTPSATLAVVGNIASKMNDLGATTTGIYLPGISSADYLNPAVCSSADYSSGDYLSSGDYTCNDFLYMGPAFPVQTIYQPYMKGNISYVTVTGTGSNPAQCSDWNYRYYHSSECNELTITTLPQFCAYDFTDTSNPTLRGCFTDWASAGLQPFVGVDNGSLSAIDIKFQGNYAYAFLAGVYGTTTENGFERKPAVVIFDITDPDNMSVSGVIPVVDSSYSTRSFTVSGNNLYLLADDVIYDYDIHNPANAKLVTSYAHAVDIPGCYSCGSVQAITSSGNYLYGVGGGIYGSGFFYIFDISDPKTIVKKYYGNGVSGNMSSNANGVKINGNYAYIFNAGYGATGASVSVVNISSSTNPVVTGNSFGDTFGGSSTFAMSAVKDIVFRDNYAYAAGSITKDYYSDVFGGVAIYNLTDSPSGNFVRVVPVEGYNDAGGYGSWGGGYSKTIDIFGSDVLLKGTRTDLHPDQRGLYNRVHIPGILSGGYAVQNSSVAGLTVTDQTSAAGVSVNGKMFSNNIFANSGIKSNSASGANYIGGALAVGKSIAVRALDVLGDIGYTGNFYKNGALINVTWNTNNQNIWFADKTSTNLAEGTNQYYTDVRAKLALSSNATGISYNNSLGRFSLTSGYHIPLIASTTAWTTAYNNGIRNIVAPLSISNHILSASVAGVNTDGYIASTSWTKFNNKMGSSTVASLSANNLPTWSTSQNKFIDGQVFQNGEYLGVGTSTSNKALTVSGDLNITGGALGQNNLYKNNNLFSAGGEELWTSNGGNKAYFVVGNVGIGSSTPNSALSVVGGLSVNGNFYKNGTLFDVAWATTSQDAWFTGKTTTNLTEGANKYFTNARIDSRMVTTLPALTSVALAGTTTDALSEGTSNKYYTDARVNTYLATVAKGTFFSTTSANAWLKNKNIQGSRWTTSGNDLYYDDGNVGIGGSSLVNQTATVFGSTTSLYKGGYFSADNMLLSSLDGGAYFGRTNVSENNFDLNNYGNRWVQSGSATTTWRSVSMSSDGKIQTAVVYGGQIYVSSDYGKTWVATGTISYWSDIAMSVDGKMQTTVSLGGQIYISTDYGLNWTLKNNTSNRWISIAVSSDGKIQTAVVNGGQIYISSDYGNTWTAKGLSFEWRGVAMSSDGKIQTAVVNGGQIYISSDYGNTWTAKGLSLTWSAVAISADGKLQTVVNSAGNIYISSDYGNTWFVKDSLPIGWSDVIMSINGKIQIAVSSVGQINISTDYGNTWTAKSLLFDWRGVAMSSDGGIMTAVVSGGQIYISHADTVLPGGNFGIGTSSPSTKFAAAGNSYFGGNATSTGTLTLTGAGTSTFSSLNITGATSTFAQGINLTSGRFCINRTCLGQDFVSTQWTTGVGSTSIYYGLGNVGVGADSGNISTSSQTLTVFGNSSAVQKAGYFSTDNMLLSSLDGGAYFGRTAIRENNFALNNYSTAWTIKNYVRNWTAIAMSSNGKIQTGLIGGSSVFVSTDFGKNWSTKNYNYNWKSVSMSSDGKIQSAVVDGGKIYISTDYGSTWTNKDSSRAWSSVSVSADGKIQTAVVNGGQVYVSENFGNTWVAKDSNRAWTGVSVSSDGKIQTAVVNGGQIYLSTDYGITWAAKEMERNWQSVAVSADGRIQTAVEYGGQIYSSLNYGATWAPKADDRSWYSVSMSASGMIQTAIATADQIYSSVDFGNTWTAQGSVQNWSSVAMSSDGKIQTAVITGGPMYISNADTYLPGGNFGVGTSSPTSMFAVGGNSFFGGNITSMGVLSLSGTGTSTLNSPLNITNTATSTFAKGINLSGGCLAVNGICLTTSQWTNNGNSLYYTAGNMGIGTTSPFAQLAVSGDVYIGGNLGSNNNLTVSGIGTTTFASALNVNFNNSYSSRFAGGINVLSGCLSVNGACITTGSYTSTHWTTSGSNIYYASGTVSVGSSVSSDFAGQSLTVFGSTTSSQNAGYFSTDNMLLSSLEGRAYFGRTKVAEGDFGTINYGLNWTQKQPALLGWQDVAVSSDGKYITAVIYNGKIYVSSDYGNTWSSKGDSNRYWRSVSMSADGKYQLATDIGTAGSYYFVSSDYGNTWSQNGEITKWFGGAVSADGRYQTVVGQKISTTKGRLYISKDFGLTWTDKSPTSAISLMSVAMSSDGKIQTAVDNYSRIFKSYNYGESWAYVAMSGNWQSVAMSADGKYQTVNGNNGSGMFKSADYGQTWVDVGLQDWSGVGISSGGKIQVATAGTGGNNNYIYLSTDFGNSWSARGPQSQWHNVALASDGKIIVAVGGGYIYVSNADTYLPGGYLGIGTSSTQYPITLASGAYVSDGGTWTNASSRDLKENFTDLNVDEILAKINQLNITQWNYKLEASSTVHIGPVAEEFYDLFKTGGSNKSISTIDPAGVALLGIQSLSKKIETLQSEMASTTILMSTSTVDIVTSRDNILSALSGLGTKISSSTAGFLELMSDKLTASVGDFQTMEVTDGMEVKDRATGEIYCVKIGQTGWDKTLGECPKVPIVSATTTSIIISTSTENNLENSTATATTTASTTVQN